MTVLILAFLSVAGAADPCGGLTVADGVVTTTAVLPVDGPTVVGACVDEVGKRLLAMTGLRTVTVTAQVPDAARVDGSATKAVGAYVERLVATGLSAGRVSSVVAAGPDPGRVVVTYTERAALDVGIVTSATGDVRIGSQTGSLAAVTPGAPLAAESWVQTGANGTAALALADGSRVRVRPDTQLQVGKLTLGADLSRVVELEIVHGGVDTEVRPAPPGSAFQVRTPYGTAGVRGTTFRVSADDATRVETLEGDVSLEAPGGAAEVTAGKGSRVDASGVPSTPKDLPGAPDPISPLQGSYPEGGLRWAREKGATAYVVEVAADAEFILDVQSRRVEKRHARPAVRPGHWYWRVAAVDDEGFVGHWSTVHGFDAR